MSKDKTFIEKNTCTPVFIAALFTIASLDFDLWTLGPDCWVSFQEGPLTPNVSLGKLLNLSVVQLPPW